MKWVPLHVHSQFSILDASASVKDIAEKAKEFQMPAVALTDHGNLYGAVDFYKACKDAKVKPIIGCELYVAPHSRFEKTKSKSGKTAHHLVLLAKDSIGFNNLCKLSSIGFLEGFYYHPRIDKEVLKKHAKGLICLSGCLSGSVASAALNGTKEELHEEILWFYDLFKEDYYLELQRHEMSSEDISLHKIDQESWLHQNYVDFIKNQEKVNKLLLEAAALFNIPCVATNDSHFIDKEDWQAHEILLNIASGEPIEIWEKDSLGNRKNSAPNPKRRTYSSHEVYFKSPDQMEALFKDIPEALSNSLKIAEKCVLELDFKTKHYPIYVPPSLEGKTFSKEEQVEAAAAYLMELCLGAIATRYDDKKLQKVGEKYPDKAPLKVVHDRLKYEMDIISSKGMCDYLLIVYDFINWAKKKGIPMGPGRGSGAGSIICYLVGITDIEPLRFNLFFERFINPERISYPDIDVDICMDRRGEVIDYTLKKYGQQNVAQIITFGTMKAKMVIKDVGRVLNVPLAKVNEIAKLIPEDVNMTLDKALDIDPQLYSFCQMDEDAKRILDLGKRLEGSIRNTGIHAAGIIISGDPLTEHIPICNSKDSDMAATQFSMKPVELMGMLKVDFLGLKTLTSIQKAVDFIKVSSGVDINWIDLSLEDAKTFELLNQGKTLGIFQMESGGMQELAKNLHLDKFEEIIAVLSLYRPGPMDMIPSFINRKHKKEEIENDHPWMQDILQETYGIMVYQEQVMQIAQKLANYSLGEGDVLRRAMGKKDMQEMAKQREKFQRGAKENGIDEETSIRIFDKMEKFAAYGFNKSHAAAYGYLTYVTAYLKAHYPKEWMAALMTCDRDDLSKVGKFLRECQNLNICILPPDVNEAGNEFIATKQGIRFAMSGIKGIGEASVEIIIKEREKKGPFKSFYNFFERIDLSKVGKKTIENLVDAGAFDFTSWTRDALRESIEEMYENALKSQKEKNAGILTFFSLMGEDDEIRFSKPPQSRNAASKHRLLIREKELLGFFLTGHPMDAYQNVMKRLSIVPLGEIEKLASESVIRSAFIVEVITVRIAHKSGKKFAILQIGDGINHYELPVWSELFDEKGHLLKENQLLYAVLSVEKKEEGHKLSVHWFDDLTVADESTIAASDLAYDKAKQTLSKLQYVKKNVPNKPQEKTGGKEMNAKKNKSSANVVIDIEKVSLSHLLKLKEIFRNHAGKNPVNVDFKKGSSTVVGSLFIDENWGINPSSDLKRKLENLTFVKEVLFT